MIQIGAPDDTCHACSRLIKCRFDHPLHLQPATRKNSKTLTRRIEYFRDQITWPMRGPELQSAERGILGNRGHFAFEFANQESLLVGKELFGGKLGCGSN